VATDDRQLEKRLSDLLAMQAIYSAIALGVIDRLAAGPMTAERMSEAIAAEPRATGHLMRLLADEGIVQGLPGGEWTLTDFGVRLRPAAPRSLHGMVMSYIELLHPAWQQLRLSIATGQSGFVAAFNTGLYEHLAGAPQAAGHFNRWMDASGSDLLPALLKAYDFAPFRSFVDVGGNRGRLSAALLAAHPCMTGTLFDLESALADAPALLAAAGVEGRCERIAGSFFEAVPQGAELYLLSRVLFNWDDARAVALLKQVRAAMPPQGVLLVIDMALPDEGSAPADTATSLNLLALFGVTLRTVGEYRGLLERVGLLTRRSGRIADTDLVLFEAVPATDRHP